ncbi:MAG: hypothetical protein SFW09_12425, partial [Hyphomicrobiaceae bacterium]|nr:hypothetical protein [Hyphomicrobiaceae bacterium]
ARERPGLAEVIDAKTACTAAIMHRNDVPFDLLPAGQIEDLRPTRARLERLAESLLAPLAGYDLVFIDGAIVGRDRLTLALAARSDVALLVVQAGSGRKSSTAEGAAILARAHGARPHIVLVQP